MFYEYVQVCAECFDFSGGLECVLHCYLISVFVRKGQDFWPEPDLQQRIRCWHASVTGPNANGCWGQRHCDAAVHWRYFISTLQKHFHPRLITFLWSINQACLVTTPWQVFSIHFPLCFHTKCIQWQHLSKFMHYFSHWNTTTSKTLFAYVKILFSKLLNLSPKHYTI